MLRRTFSLWMTIHSARAIPFEISPKEANDLVHTHYRSKWLVGAKGEFIETEAPSPEFIPFYLCNGTVRAIAVGSVQYSSTNHSSSNNNSTTSSHWVTTQPIPIESTFHENRTQVYGGYKYNNRHIYHALRHEVNPMKMKKISEVDVSVGSINLFEMSSNTLRLQLVDEVQRQVKEVAEKQIRLFHPNAQSVQVSFKTFDIKVEDVYPTFVPCHVVKATYDEEAFTVYVSGSERTVGAPYLLNSLLLARAASAITTTAMILFTPFKFYGLLLGALAYPLTFYGTKYFPAMRRDYYRRQRDTSKATNQANDDTGFKPSASSQRITEEYQRSTYWDTHKFQQRKSETTESSGPGSSKVLVRDVKGYYKLIGVPTGASVNEIRSAYRQLVLMQHPDAGGSTEKMAQVNEAYRTLRDPKLRDEYDKS